MATTKPTKSNSTNKICSIAGCVKPSECHAMCRSHYGYWYRTGDALTPRKRATSQPERLCSIEGCRHTVDCHGLCGTHNMRRWTHGDPNITLLNRGVGATAEERFWSRINKNGRMHPTNSSLGRCWEWLGFVNEKGYGRVVVDGQKYAIHRYSWLLANGKLPAGLLLHSCDNPRCVNIEHLREGTHQENVDDMIGRQRGHWQKPRRSNAVLRIK